MEIHEEYRPTVRGTGSIRLGRVDAVDARETASPEALSAAVEERMHGSVDDAARAAGGRLRGYVLTALWADDAGYLTSATAQMLSIAEWPAVLDAAETAYRQAAEAAIARGARKAPEEEA